MKASDSATSLTGLTTQDTGCFFCAEGDDAEGAKVLYDSKSVLSCGCRFSVHLSCWSEYLNKGPAGARPDCPVCKKPVIPTRIVEVHAPAEKSKDPCPNSTKLIFLFAVLACIIIFFLILHSLRFL